MTAKHVIYIMVVLLLSTSCLRPELYENIPVIKEASEAVEGNSVTLNSSVIGQTGGIVECGFMYGQSEVGMRNVKTYMIGRNFSTTIYDLDWDKEYVYYAYISNGRNVVKSSVHRFRTPVEPVSPPDQPEDPDDPELPVDPEPEPGPDPVPGPDPEIPVVPEEHYFELSMTELDFSGTCASRFISVKSNVEYEVIIPENAPWLTCTESTSTRCCLIVDYNYCEQDRSCEVLFRSLEHDCSHTVLVRQKRIPMYELHVSHVETRSYAYPLPESVKRPTSVMRIDDQGNDSQAKWMAAIKFGDDLQMTFRNNRTDEIRTEKVRVQKFYMEEGFTETIIVKVIQHTASDIMGFECPAVERKCVKLWDLNGDGYLSYGEAADATTAPEYAFSGAEYTSFDNFQWFVGLKDISPYMFASSGVTSISLPATITSISEGAFQDCADLRSVRLHGDGPVLASAAESAFQGTHEDLVIICPWQWVDWYISHIPHWEGLMEGYGM